MNKLKAIFLFASCILAASCDQSDSAAEPTLRDKLLKTWNLTDGGYVKANGLDITKDYTDLSFAFRADGTYTSIVNGSSMDGQWRATDSSISTLILDEMTTINILELTEKTLAISFASEGMINSRIKGVSTFEVLLAAK